MSDKDFEKLMDIAKMQLEEVKKMTKKEAIASLHDAGILTKKGKFTKPYAILEQK
ncbi:MULTISPECIES: hypothetical protein [Mucilaginibacter]|uniref:hypothetical protein n=1 Tax=Mucilaginibacter TaxID=423349 RepID=UPI0020935234|nr:MULTISPECIES: hypothetical protein [Mucilaginibacter]MCO5949243.1 hypothetical protein [Mucilaginibacter flavidus]